MLHASVCLQASLRRYIPSLRRKNFFSMMQQTGQDEQAFAEVVKLAASESDIAALTLKDALSLVIPTGCKDSRLCEKMSELEEPTMAAFNTLIDAHMHSKATAAEDSSARTNSQPNRGRGENGRGGQAGQQNLEQQPILYAEKKRRQVMKGKCFRCASSDYFSNNCFLAKDIQCKKCNNTGHLP